MGLEPNHESRTLNVAFIPHCFPLACFRLRNFAKNQYSWQESKNVTIPVAGKEEEEEIRRMEGVALSEAQNRVIRITQDLPDLRSQLGQLESSKSRPERRGGDHLAP